MNTMEYSKDGIDNLRCAVVLQAVKDYKHALRSRKTSERESLERFFMGEGIEFWTDIDGKDIMEKCKKDVGIID